MGRPPLNVTTHRQHYVWRRYLEPWTTKKGRVPQIWCLRREGPAPIRLGITNVAVQRDFYRLHNLERGDVEFVRAMGISQNTNPTARETNERWIAMIGGMIGMQRELRDRLSESPQLREELDRVMIEHQENDYSRMESRAVAHLEALQGGDVTFFAVDEEAIKFSYFLAHQYFRTKAIRDRIRDTFPAQSDRERFERTWPILRYIFATNIGCEIFRSRKSVKLQVVEAAPGMKFITSDQPAINTYGAFVPERTPIEEMELFYPVSPTRAVILSGHPVYQDTHGKALEPFRMGVLNQAIERVAYEQLFADSDDALNPLVPYFCSRDTAK